MMEDIRETVTDVATNVTRASENTTITLESDLEAPPSKPQTLTRRI